MRQALAIVMSTTALGVAVLGSTPVGDAAATIADQIIPRNSVGPLQLKRNAVRAKNVAPDAVRTGHVQDGSLLAADFKPGQLPKGDTGPRGEKGDRGERGEKGEPGATTVVVRRREDVASSGASSGVFLVAVCEAGERVLAGGVSARAPVQINGSQPRPTTGSGGTPTGWEGTFSWPATTAAGVPFATSVICARP